MVDEAFKESKIEDGDLKNISKNLEEINNSINSLSSYLYEKIEEYEKKKSITEYDELIYILFSNSIIVMDGLEYHLDNLIKSHKENGPDANFDKYINRFIENAVRMIDANLSFMVKLRTRKYMTKKMRLLYITKFVSDYVSSYLKDSGITM